MVRRLAAPSRPVAAGTSLTGLAPRLALLAALAGGGGCDAGHHLRRTGPVDEAALCRPETLPLVEGEPCPPCSTLGESGLCHDRNYASMVRCGADSGCGPGGRCRGGRCVYLDADGDGVDDALEREVAERNLPALHFHPDESCGGPRAVVYRSRPHPEAPERLAVTYVVLYQRDCGAWNGHLGDDEALAVTVDLEATPGAAATVGLLSSAHRNTLCGSTSSCETGPAMRGCAPEGADRAVVYASADKHANYLDLDSCNGNCFDRCAAGPIDLELGLLDVGQPEAPLSTDLTRSGLVRAQAGWSAPLLHFDPWSGSTFGDAGHVRAQLLELLAPAGLPTSL